MFHVQLWYKGIDNELIVCCSAVAIFELFPSMSDVNEENGPASVSVQLAAGSGELTFAITVTIETISGGTATGEFIGKLATIVAQSHYFLFFPCGYSDRRLYFSHHSSDIYFWK